MKEGLHPEYHPVVFVDSAADFELVTRSTKTSSETRDIDGVDHYVIRVEISSASHPFFTGEQRFVDTAGRVEKFQRRYEQFYQQQDDAKQKVVKKAKAAAPAVVPEAAEDVAESADLETAPEAEASIEAEADTADEESIEVAVQPATAEASSVDGDDDDPEAES